MLCYYIVSLLVDNVSHHQRFENGGLELYYIVEGSGFLGNIRKKVK